MAQARWVVVLFFVVSGPIRADEEQLRKALDQLSASFAETQQRLHEREAVVKSMTESLAIARTESEMFQKLWTEAQMRVQTLDANLTETGEVATQRQLIESLRAVYIADAERQRLVGQLRRLAGAVESNRNVVGEIEATKQLLVEVQKSPATATTAGQGTVQRARVLDVNLKLRLVVLDVGAQQGARVGMPMVVEHSERAVAEVRIVEVRQKICGALIEKIENKVMPATGDVARVTRNN